MPQIVQNIEVLLSEPQEAVLECRKSQILEMGAKGAGKSETISISSGMFVTNMPEAVGFIGANTNLQLSQSTLANVFKSWKRIHDYTEYDKVYNKSGAYVVDKKPPFHFQKFRTLRNYAGTISFYNGALIYIGSLENYKAHDGKEFAYAHLDETKDTKEAALKEVIEGRLRQFGLWFGPDGTIYWDDKINEATATARAWTAWNPLYIHTAPAGAGVSWLNEKFKLEKFAAEIKEKVTQDERDFFYKEFENKAVCIYSVHHNAHNLPPNYIELQKERLVTEDAILRHVNGYPFTKTGGEYYWGFRRDKVVRKVNYIPGAAVLQGWDFNAVPYMTCICLQVEHVTKFLDAVGNKHLIPQEGFTPLEVTIIRVYREYTFASPKNSIEAISYQFAAEHDSRLTEVFYYGDSQGTNRIEGLGRTRFSYVEEYFADYLHNDSKKVKNPNVKELLRRDLVNDMLRGKYPDIEIIIDEGCVNLIKDFEQLKEGIDGKIKPRVTDKATGQSWEDLGHAVEGLEYILSEAFKYLLKQ